MLQKSPKSYLEGAVRLLKESDASAIPPEATRMALICTDGQTPGNPIVFANDAALALTGLVRAEILGDQIDAVLRDTADSRVLALIQQAIATGSEGTWELRCRRVDGTQFSAFALLSTARDDDGAVQQNCLALVELGAYLDRLVIQRDELRTIYENAPGFIATTHGPDHCFSFANASYRKFVGRDRLEGLTVAEALPEAAEQGFVAILDEVYQTGEPFLAHGMPMEAFDPVSGTFKTRYSDFIYQPVRDVDGEITGLFCEGYDVTSQREASDALAVLQADLIHASRVNTMGTMAATLAHELNQPLSAISNYTAGLRQLGLPPQDADQFDKAIKGIEDASRRGVETIRVLRELTRRREPARMAFDLKPAVAECVKLVKASTPSDIRLIDRVPKGMTMMADRIQIQQVLINLFRNACEAVVASDRREITISAREEGNMVVVSVSDTGPGVPIESARSIFSWFDSLKTGGMGLGLSICRTIVQSHRGRIWLENSDSDGAEFCFSIPLRSPDQPSNSE